MNKFTLVFIFSILFLSWESRAQMASHSEATKKILSEKIEPLP